MKSKDSLWPTVVWKGSQLLVYYLGENEDDVEVRETREIDFEEFFLHLDKGGSVFVTMKPRTRFACTMTSRWSRRPRPSFFRTTFETMERVNENGRRI